MKKKILTLAIVVALVAIVVGSSLAYFTAEDKADNTFTIGSVKIEIYENGSATESDTIPMGKLTPIVKTDDPASDVSYVKKAVTVKNIGKNAAYIRTHIAIPTQLVGYLYLDLSTSGWERQADSTATVNGVNYTVFTYNHTAAVDPEKSTNQLLNGVYLGSSVDLEEDAAGNLVFILRDENGNKTATSGFIAHTKNADGTYTSENVNVLVVSQAIQKDGFETAKDALESGFGTANPWAN